MLATNLHSTFSEGNLENLQIWIIITKVLYATFGVSSGKWYCEIKTTDDQCTYSCWIVDIDGQCRQIP